MTFMSLPAKAVNDFLDVDVFGGGSDFASDEDLTMPTTDFDGNARLLDPRKGGRQGWRRKCDHKVYRDDPARRSRRCDRLFGLGEVV